METLEEQIKHVLSLKNNWDDEGSISYKKETVDKAMKYIPEMNKEFFKRTGIKLEKPRLLAGPEGSIDLHWKNEKYELLLNVPIKGPAAYYGEAGNKKIEKENFYVRRH